PDRLNRFFVRTDTGFHVSRLLREMVLFAHHDLAKDPPFSRIDLISCRNVLIYMQPQLQKKLLRIFHYALNTDGCLLLGSSESVGDAVDLFSTVDRRLKIYMKKHAMSAAVFEFNPNRPLLPPSDFLRPTVERRSPLTIQQLAERKVIEKYGPPGVVVADNMEVVQFRGQTGSFL